MATPVITVLRADERYRTDQNSISSWHCFSAGSHYDPANTAFGPLVACDHHLVAAGAGFARHRHGGVVIVSWPISGVLEHEDAEGIRTPVAAGSFQQLISGAGIEHGEFAGEFEPAQFLQLTLLGERPVDGSLSGPGYVVRPVEVGELVVVTTVRTPFGPATLRVARLPAQGSTSVELIPHPRRFLFVARGSVDLATGEGAVFALRTGDSARITDADVLRVRARPPSAETGLGESAEVLVWDLPG